MMAQLLTKIAGPRILLGVIFAAVASVGTLTWLLLDAKQDQGAAESRAETAEVANTVWQQAWTDQQARIKANAAQLNAIDRRLSESSKQSTSRLNALNAGLRDAINDSKEVREWADSRRPDAVIERLCLAGYIDPAARAAMCGDTGSAD
jgi:hypothetical protein